MTLVLSHLSFIYVSEKNVFPWLCQILFTYLPQNRCFFLTVNQVLLVFFIIANHQIKGRIMSFVLILFFFSFILFISYPPFLCKFSGSYWAAVYCCTAVWEINNKHLFLQVRQRIQGILGCTILNQEAVWLLLIE